MRLLTLVRHAKSSWDHEGLSDFERPLNPRGRRDAPLMAERARQWWGKPDRFVSSPALRAITTAQVFAQHLGLDPQEIVLRPRIYEASSARLLEMLQGCDDHDRQIMLFGHNPGLSQFAHELARCDFEDLPTCGMAHLTLDLEHWHEARAGCGKLLRFSCPREKLLD
jgi:phosphohistidine phosphatase